MPKKNKWEILGEQFAAIPEGAVVRSSSGDLWLKQEQRDDYHIDGCLTNLKTGKIKHWSFLVEVGHLAEFEGFKVVSINLMEELNHV